MNSITKYAIQNLEKNDITNSECYLEKSKDNKNIIKFTKDNKANYIGSRYSVDRDINIFLSQIGDFNVNTLFIVFGLAAGEHIVALLNKITNTNKILIIEPDINIIKLLLETKDYSAQIIDNDRVVITPCEESMLDAVFNTFIGDYAINNIKFLFFANYDKLYREKYLLSYNMIKNYIEVMTMNIVTNQGFAKDFFKCFVKNIKHIIKSTVINETKNCFSGIPAVVVSAGPSLEKNIELLKNVQNKFLILSGGRTISSLNKVNVSPHVVSVIDPGEPSYEVIKNSLDCKAPLLFCEVTNYKVVQEYSGERIFVQYNRDGATKEILDTNIDILFQGGSVAHTCTSYAQYLGCNPIIFIGQDFAYTNNKFHADIASIENNDIDNEKTIMVQDINGERIPTSKLLDLYRKNMEQFIRKHPDNTFINCTEGGANIEGTKVITLKDAIELYSTNEIDKEKFSILSNKINSFNKEQIKVKIETILMDLKELRSKADETVENCKQIIDYYENNKRKNINRLLNNIKEINAHIVKAKFLNNLLQPVIFQVLMNPEYMEKINESKKESGIRFAKQTIKLFTGIIISIDEALPYIEECISELNRAEV